MKNQAPLKLLGEVWADLQHPDLIWQMLALAISLALAWLFARWWQGKTSEEDGKLYGASTRLAFPLSALLLAAMAHELFEHLQQHTKLLAVAMSLLGSLALVRCCVYLLRRSFPAAGWLAVSERWVAALIWIGLALHLTGLAPLAIGLLERVSMSVGNTDINLWMVGKGVLTVMVTIVLALWIAGLIEARLLGVQELDSSLRIVSVRVAKALLTLIAVLAGLSLVGIDITALSVFTGALGVGLGLGLQKIASNYVSGFIILLDRSIRLGNVVQVGADSGVVTEITTRYTVLKNPTGVEFIVPNETLIGNTVQNQSYSDSRVRVAFSLGVAYATADVSAVLRLMEEIAGRHPRVISDPPPRAFLQSFGDSAIQLELGFWIADPEEGQGNVRSDVALAVWDAFRERGVEIPFPQRVVRTVPAGS